MQPVAFAKHASKHQHDLWLLFGGQCVLDELSLLLEEGDPASLASSKFGTASLRARYRSSHDAGTRFEDLMTVWDNSGLKPFTSCDDVFDYDKLTDWLWWSRREWVCRYKLLDASQIDLRDGWGCGSYNCLVGVDICTVCRKEPDNAEHIASPPEYDTVREMVQAQKCV
jgi:hypothetical protein